MILGIIGTSRDGEEWMQIGDITHSVFITKEAISKKELEILQIRRFQEISERAGCSPYVLMRHDDRPDFVALRNGERITMDVAAFAYTERRKAASQFRKIKELFIREHRKGKLKQCAGLNIYLKFQNERIPHHSTLVDEVCELVLAFEGLTYDRKAWDEFDGMEWVDGNNPDPYPMGVCGRTHNGTIEWYISGICDVANSFSMECQFNLQHEFETCVTVRDIKERIDEIVSKHDKVDQNIDELIIIAGGPDVFGDALGDETYLAMYFAENGRIAIRSPKNLKAVWLCCWNLDKIYKLYDRGIGY